MSRSYRIIRGKVFPVSKLTENPLKDKNSKKSFVYRDEGSYTKAQGGIGNKRGWKPPIPKWLYKKYKENGDSNG